MSIEERRAMVARRDPAKVLAAERRRSRTPQKLASIARSKTLHHDRHLARVAVSNAVRRGHLTRLPCFCGNPKSEAHHPDYSKRLEVEWLCRIHHTERHFRP